MSDALDAILYGREFHYDNDEFLCSFDAFEHEVRAVAEEAVRGCHDSFKVAMAQWPPGTMYDAETVRRIFLDVLPTVFPTAFEEKS